MAADLLEYVGRNESRDTRGEGVQEDSSRVHSMVPEGMLGGGGGGGGGGNALTRLH